MNRHESEELMPWAANGTLDPEQAAALARAVAEDPALAEEQRFTQRLHSQMQQLAAEDEGPGEWGWARLKRDLKQAPPAQRGWQWWQPALAACLLVIAVQTTWIALPEDSAGYQPLGADPAATTAVSAPTVKVQFAADASAGAIAALLNDLNARVIDGPGAVGLYTLALPADAEPAAVVATLSARDDLVVHAQP